MAELPLSDVADPAAGYRLLRHAVAGHWLDRDFIQVTGPAAITYLQGQCSQDLAGLGAGESTWSWVLQPQGKVEALVRVTRTADDTMVLDTDRGWGDALIARLNRFRIRVKAELAPLEWRCLALRGPDAARRPGEAPGGGALVVDSGWAAWPGFDLIGADVPTPVGLAMVDAAVYDAARISAGVPRMGAELTEKTIPAETGLIDRTVSFTKGCYTGQELVARIDSRGGHVPRNLRGVVLEGVAPGGSEVAIGDKTVGALTSVAARPGGTGALALAYVRRDVEPPADARVTWDGGATAARIELLPLGP